MTYTKTSFVQDRRWISELSVQADVGDVGQQHVLAPRKVARRLSRTPDTFGGVVDVFKTLAFRVIDQLVEDGQAGVALETDCPEGPIEGEVVGDAVRRRLQCVWISEMLHFLWCECLPRANILPPSGDFIIPQMGRFVELVG